MKTSDYVYIRFDSQNKKKPYLKKSFWLNLSSRNLRIPTSCCCLNFYYSPKTKLSLQVKYKKLYSEEVARHLFGKSAKK